VRGTFRVAAHMPPPAANVALHDREEDEDRFVGRPCYEFNARLLDAWNDRHCSHCRFYLTARCPHIDEFLDDVEDLSPE
jgi:hypothetical protein